MRAEFLHVGMTFADWARARGYRPEQVHDVVRGRAQGKFGISHDIAVELGMKVGIVNKARRATAAAPKAIK